MLGRSLELLSRRAVQAILLASSLQDFSKALNPVPSNQGYPAGAGLLSCDQEVGTGQEVQQRISFRWGLAVDGFSQDSSRRVKSRGFG